MPLCSIAGSSIQAKQKDAALDFANARRAGARMAGLLILEAKRP
jgi:hypothetical protein